MTATDARGNRRCVTIEADYQSNASTIADADRRGLIAAGKIPGEAAILVRYMGHVGVCRVTIPHSDGPFRRPPETNFVDRHVWDKLQRLGIQPSEPADDATFLRRAYLDVTGTLPTAEEAARFLADTQPDKRSRLIASLFDRDAYADYWTLFWSDLLRVDKDAHHAARGHRLYALAAKAIRQ